ncbi:MAG: hypothetical protein NVS2B12_13940 [Ktedonobacteraceae bacterium]
MLNKKIPFFRNSAYPGSIGARDSHAVSFARTIGSAANFCQYSLNTYICSAKEIHQKHMYS